MPETLSITEARQQLAKLAGRVRLAGDRILLEKRGEAVAALVPPADLEALEALEDRLDLLDALDALADYRAGGGVPLEELEAEFDR